MTRRNELACQFGVSPKLGRLLSKSDEATLSTISRIIFSELQHMTLRPEVTELLRNCMEAEAELSDSYFIDLEIKLGESEPDDSLFSRDQVIVEVCWGFIKGETLLNSVDKMLYHLTGLENHERDLVMNLALNETIGWHSSERGK